jgi:Fe2+ or Zn2+ uptake regulation protein
VARRILRYLFEHPAAADSAAGIRHWWLQDDEQFGESIVNDALETLAERGWVRAYGAKSEERIYGFNEAAKSDSGRFLEDARAHLNG